MLENQRLGHFMLHLESHSRFSQHIIVYPVSQDELVNCVFFTKDLTRQGTIYHGPLSSSCTQEELLANFAGWEEEVQALIQVCTFLATLQSLAYVHSY